MAWKHANKCTANPTNLPVTRIPITGTKLCENGKDRRGPAKEKMLIGIRIRFRIRNSCCASRMPRNPDVTVTIGMDRASR